MKTTPIIHQIESEQMRSDIPDFKAGDTVIVKIKVTEGTRQRLQAFEGVVIAKRNRGLNSSFIVRKISHGEGVERTFQTHSPLIESIAVIRMGDVRRAKLYYLRELSGKKARIKEKILSKEKRAQLLEKSKKATSKKTTKIQPEVIEKKSEQPKEIEKSAKVDTEKKTPEIKTGKPVKVESKKSAEEDSK